MLCNWNEREEVILVYATAIDIWSRWCSWLSRRSHNMIAPGARNLISGGRQFDPGTGHFLQSIRTHLSRIENRMSGLL